MEEIGAESILEITQGRTQNSLNALHGGYRYSKDGKPLVSGHQSWRCIEKGCKGRNLYPWWHRHGMLEDVHCTAWTGPTIQLSPFTASLRSLSGCIIQPYGHSLVHWDSSSLTQMVKFVPWFLDNDHQREKRHKLQEMIGSSMLLYNLAWWISFLIWILLWISNSLSNKLHVLS